MDGNWSTGSPSSGHAHRTLYKGLIVDEELADQVWQAWDKGEIDDQVAWFAWRLISSSGQQTGRSSTKLKR